MITAEQFIGPALKRGYAFWTGVPCSFLTPFINYVIQSGELTYVGATSEGEAVGLAAGAVLGGKKAVAICQNSGLGNMVNPLTSLTFPFRIPMLLIVTHRGEPGLKDEPQHELMGQITTGMLELMRVRWADFPEDAMSVDAALKDASETMDRTGLPFAFVMKKGAVAPVALERPPSPRRTGETVVGGRFAGAVANRMLRREALGTIASAMGDRAALIATTGKTGRELFTLGTAENHIYIVGSMGCASSIGLGLRLAHQSPDPIVVLDGDGAALMKMGTMATIGHTQPRNFIHVILDNETHDSTGGQATVSATVDFAGVAAACGYHAAYRTDTKAEVAAILKRHLSSPGPVLLHVKIAPGSLEDLGRPTLSPVEVKERFMGWVSRGRQ